MRGPSRNRSGWKLLWLTALLCCVPGGISRGQTKESEPTRERIILRLRDGRPGFPIWAEYPNVWVARQEGVNPATNWKGEIVVDVTGAVPRELRFLPNWHADCRYEGDLQNGWQVKYSITEILSKGVVGENVCGKKQAKPVPGVLVLYVRPRTLKEAIALWVTS
jgi:hypothetical protein